MNLDLFLQGIEQFARLDSNTRISEEKIELNGRFYHVADLLTEFYTRSQFEAFDYDKLQQIGKTLDQLALRIKQDKKVSNNQLLEVMSKSQQVANAVIEGDSIKTTIESALDKSIQVVNGISDNIIGFFLGNVAQAEQSRLFLIENTYWAPLVEKVLEMTGISLTSEEYRLLNSEKAWPEMRILLTELLKEKLHPKALEALQRTLDNYHAILEKIQTEERALIRDKVHGLNEFIKHHLTIPGLEKLSEQFFQGLGEFMQQKGRHPEQILQWKNHFYQIYNTSQRFCSSVEGELYLQRGVCAGASLEQALKQIEFSEHPSNGESPTIQPSSMARFLQAMYVVEVSKSQLIDQHEAVVIEYCNVLLLLAKQKAGENESSISSEPLEKKKLELEKTLEQLNEQFLAQQAVYNFSPAFAKKYGFLLQSLMPDEIVRKGKFISIDEFLNAMIDNILADHKGEDVHLIVGLRYSLRDEVAFFQSLSKTNDSSTASKDYQPLEEHVVEKRIHEILEGEETEYFTPAPESVKRKLKAKLQQKHMEAQKSSSNEYSTNIGHAIYIKLSPNQFEFGDVNLPGAEIFKTSDINTFRLFLLQWLSLNPYQKVDKIQRVIDPKKKTTREEA